MSRKKRQRRSKQQRSSLPIWIAAFVLAVVAVAAVFVLMGDENSPPDTEPTKVAAASPTAQPRVVGGVDGCRHGPRFQSYLDLSSQAALVTNITNVTGIAIIDKAGNNGQGLLYQHESWDDAGFIGPFITDRMGHIYVAPVPLVSLVENPPDEQNRVYRIDTDSQVMALLADLPAAQPASGNPFGVVGLAYDCETDSLYATSLAGSTATSEVGRIFHIDLETGDVLDQLDDVDAIGVSVYNGPVEKRLYFGRARLPEVHSIALDDAGNFIGEPRLEFSYANATTAGRDTVRRIRFEEGADMKLHLLDFNYSLQVASQQQEDTIVYRQNLETGEWTQVE